jgi:hypothetical protein
MTSSSDNELMLYRHEIAQLKKLVIELKVSNEALVSASTAATLAHNPILHLSNENGNDSSLITAITRVITASPKYRTA